MPRRVHTGPRWIKAEGDPKGFVMDARTGVFYLRKNFSPGPGQKPRQVVRSLGTKAKAEALKRFDVIAGKVRLGVEQARPRTEKEDVEYWKALRATGTRDAENAYDAEIELRLGEPVVGSVPGTGTTLDDLARDPDEPVYDPKREAEVLRFTGLVDGTRTPVDFYVDGFVDGKAMRHASRIKLTLRQLTAFLAERGKPNHIKALDRRTASDFIAHLVKTEGSLTTAGSKRSALTAYWEWLVSRDDAEENVWRGHKMPKRTGKREVRAYTAAEMVKLLDGPAPAYMADFIRFAALSGMRREEIGRLRVRDCAGGWFDVLKSKTEAGVRRVPIHPDLAAMVARRATGKAPDDFLFHDLPKSDGEGRERAEKVGERFTGYRRKVGVDDRREDGRSRIDFHSFRRWFITEALRHSGEPEWAVSEVVGHTVEKSLAVEVYYDGSHAERLQRIVESVRLPTQADLQKTEGHREEAA